MVDISVKSYTLIRFQSSSILFIVYQFRLAIPDATRIFSAAIRVMVVMLDSEFSSVPGTACLQGFSSLPVVGNNSGPRTIYFQLSSSLSAKCIDVKSKSMKKLWLA